MGWNVRTRPWWPIDILREERRAYSEEAERRDWDRWAEAARREASIFEREDLRIFETKEGERVEGVEREGSVDCGVEWEGFVEGCCMGEDGTVVGDC